MTDSRSLTLAQAVRTTLEAAMADDDGIVVLGDAVARAGGTAGTTAGLADAYADRVLDLPVADRGTLGYALGLALGGRRAVVELADTSRLPAVIELLAEAAATAARGAFQVPLVVRVPYGTEAVALDRPAGPWLGAVPGLRVLVPSTPGQAAGLLSFALSASTPTVLLEPRSLYDDRGPVADGAVAPGLRVVREGSHVTLATWGSGVSAAVDAADRLAAEGVQAEVLDLVQLAPLDRDGLGRHVRATGRLVVVHPGDSALARHIRVEALDVAFLYLESPMSDAPADGSSIARVALDSVRY